MNKKVSDIFDVKYGVNLELNALDRDPNGFNFVSRTAKNNGVSARVKPLTDVEPIPAGTISVAGGGSVMESFLQTEPYYSGRDLYYLTPKIELTEAQLLYYCVCLKANKYRFNYGRQANKTLKDIKIPDPKDLPNWLQEESVHIFDGKDKPLVLGEVPKLFSEKWSPFLLSDLFVLKKGKRITKEDMDEGATPFIGAIDSNNGYRQFINRNPMHEANTITVNYNGSVAESFYQPFPFWASDDVNVLYPKFELNVYIALFILTVIRKEKYRYNYGRKWNLDRMEKSAIFLPSTNNQPDFVFMENYVKSLPFSDSLLTDVNEVRHTKSVTPKKQNRELSRIEPIKEYESESLSLDMSFDEALDMLVNTPLPDKKKQKVRE